MYNEYVFIAFAVLGILWSLVLYFKEKELNWSDFNFKYILRYIPDMLILYTEFEILMKTALIPQDIVVCVFAGFMFGWQSDTFIKKVTDFINKFISS